MKGFEETAGLAPALESVNDELDQAYELRMARRKPMVRTRAHLRISEYKADRAIRSSARGVEIADGGRKGPLYRSVFPQGLSEVVAPAGTRQVKPFTDYLDRMRKCRLSGAQAMAEEWLPRLEPALSALSQAVEAYKNARADYLDALHDEYALRDEHEMAVEKVMGQVRTAFPGDRRRQDSVFPRMHSGGGDDREPDEDVAIPGADGSPDDGP